MDAKLHETQVSQSRVALAQARLEQEKEILERSNRWLNEELERKSEAFSAERRKATDTILDLQRRLAEAEGGGQRAQAQAVQQHGKLEQQTKAAEVGGAWGLPGAGWWGLAWRSCLGLATTAPCFPACTRASCGCDGPPLAPLVQLTCCTAWPSCLAACLGMPVRMQEVAARLREVREEAAAKEEQFEKELGMSQRMAQLYRESGEERAKKCAELEGVVMELKTHMEAAAAAQREALEKADATRQAAERRLLEERALRERMMAAAGAGNQALLTAVGAAGASGTPSGLGTARAGGRGAASPGLSPGSAAPAELHGLTTTEAYSKYTEMHERWRAERLKTRQQEIVMEELCSEVEKRAALVKEQQVGVGRWGRALWLAL